eukprot:366029-Chlamydomonas_euryale.AAC.39
MHRRLHCLQLGRLLQNRPSSTPSAPQALLVDVCGVASQEDSDWCGTKRFGMCYVDQEGRMAAIGTTLEITVWPGFMKGQK